RCKAENPGGKRFCGDCGGPLDPTLTAVSQLVDSSVKEQIQSILSERYKDQKLVEIETTQAVAARLSEWTKLFGFFIGIPVAVLLLILAVLGIKSYSDFVAQIGKLQSEATAELKTAQTKL